MFGNFDLKMVTSRIPAYSLSSEFNREFRSFRITRATPRSTLYAPAIVPIHEYPRVSVHERREALKAALAKAWSSKSTEKKKHDTWTVPNEQTRAGIIPTEFTRNSQNGDVSHVALAKHDLESKDVERTEAVDHRANSSMSVSFAYSSINRSGIDIQETLKKGCDKGLHTKDLSYSEYLNNVPKCKTSFENSFLKQSHEERYSKRNGYDATNKRVDRDINLNNVEYSSLNGDTYDSLKYSRSANGTESVQYKSYGKADTVKSKLLSTDSPKSVTSCNDEKLNGYSGLERRGAKEQQRPLTSGPKAVVEQRLAERLEVKVAELPALYRGVDSWTPKSAAFQKNMRDHEWSVSYVQLSSQKTLKFTNKLHSLYSKNKPFKSSTFHYDRFMCVKGAFSDISDVGVIEDIVTENNANLNWLRLCASNCHWPGGRVRLGLLIVILVGNRSNQCSY